MGSSWKSFAMPKRVECDEKSLTPVYGKFIVEPFERGYGTTLVNALRRVLISSIEGSAVTSIRVEGVQHEFSGIPGVSEDVPEIILNIKKLVLRSHTSDTKVISIKTAKKGPVLAKDITMDDTVEVINPNHVICTLSKLSSLLIEMEVGKGRGYVSAERNKKEGQSIGVIPIDSIFTPVTRVNFHVENTRVGQMTDYERIILEIWTNGAIAPKDALVQASVILQRHLDVFTGSNEIVEEEHQQETTQEEIELWSKLKQPVSELELSVRSTNCLREANIKMIAELVQRNEQEMLKYRNFGKKSLAEIQNVLKHMGLSLGMNLDKFEKLKQQKQQEVSTSS